MAEEISPKLSAILKVQEKRIKYILFLIYLEIK